MKKQGKTGAGMVAVVIIALLILAFIGYGIYTLANKPVSVNIQGGAPGTAGSSGCSQNPAVTVTGTDKLTGASVTTSIRNAVDKSTGALIGPVSVSSGVMTPAMEAGKVITPLVNASGYVASLKGDYTVKCGTQSLAADLYQYQNATVQVYNNLGTGILSIANTTNESIFSTQANNKIVLTGNTYKSAGRLFVIYEVSNTSSVGSVALNAQNGAPAATTASVPNCYTNTLPGTPYRAAFEIPESATLNGAVNTYTLQTVSQAGSAIVGRAALVVCAEQDGIDSLTGKILTSGICDSGNKVFGVGSAPNANGVSTSTSTGVSCQTTIWSIGNLPF